MDPTIWGPSAWALIHQVCDNDSKETPHTLLEIKDFLASLKKLNNALKRDIDLGQSATFDEQETP